MEETHPVLIQSTGHSGSRRTQSDLQCYSTLRTFLTVSSPLHTVENATWLAIFATYSDVFFVVNETSAAFSRKALHNFEFLGHHASWALTLICGLIFQSMSGEKKRPLLFISFCVGNNSCSPARHPCIGGAPIVVRRVSTCATPKRQCQIAWVRVGDMARQPTEFKPPCLRDGLSCWKMLSRSLQRNLIWSWLRRAVLRSLVPTTQLAPSTFLSFCPSPQPTSQTPRSPRTRSPPGSLRTSSRPGSLTSRARGLFLDQKPTPTTSSRFRRSRFRLVAGPC